MPEDIGPEGLATMVTEGAALALTVMVMALLDAFVGQMPFMLLVSSQVITSPLTRELLL